MHRVHILSGATSAALATPSAPSTHHTRYTHTIHHAGNRYFATAEMAAIFETHAADIVRLGETELVPLSHRSGVDLLLISPQANFAVVAIEVGHLETGLDAHLDASLETGLDAG